MGSEQRSARNWFSGLPLDRSGQWRERVGRGEVDVDLGTALTFHISSRGEVLIESGGGLASVGTPEELLTDVERRLSLGTHEGRIVLALIATDEQREALSDGQRQWIDLRLAALTLPHVDAGYAAYARALVHWHQRHRYCGQCGASTRIELGGHRRRCNNDNCGLEQFPRLDPAIIVLVEHAGRVLLGRQASWPPRRYSVLAGFVEPGESLEDALRREVLEESGVVVVECDYHSSQPWPFPASLMLGFTARAEHDELRYGDELEHAAWFSPAELLDAVGSGEVRLPPPLSLSARLLEDWYEARTGRPSAEIFAPPR
ncbi:MAG TPA: NAD(+) diphosphatase [Xanthomonadales bacterium]|nr:NAD(+) diphosphatase [Xanthomonadales bacterium]